MAWRKPAPRWHQELVLHSSASEVFTAWGPLKPWQEGVVEMPQAQPCPRSLCPPRGQPRRRAPELQARLVRTGSTRGRQRGRAEGLLGTWVLGTLL